MSLLPIFEIIIMVGVIGLALFLVYPELVNETISLLHYFSGLFGSMLKLHKSLSYEYEKEKESRRSRKRKDFQERKIRKLMEKYGFASQLPLNNKKNSAGFAGNIRRFREESPSSPLRRKQKYMVSESTQVTARDFHELRTQLPFRPFYHRSLRQSNPQVSDIYNLEPQLRIFDGKHTFHRGVQTFAYTTNSIELPNLPENEMVSLESVHEEENPIQQSDEATNASTQVIHQEPLFEVCPWSSEVESIYFISTIHITVQRYFEQTLHPLSVEDEIRMEIKNTLNGTNNTLELSQKGLRLVPNLLSAENVITNLDLSFNKISYLPDFFFESLKALTHLNLAGNYLFRLDHKFSDLKKLRSVNLSYNKLHLFPYELMRLPHLHDLDISHNMLINIPAEVGSMKLTNFNISYNLLIWLPEKFSLLTKRLKSFSMEDNNFLYSVTPIMNKFQVVAPFAKTEGVEKLPKSSRVMLILELIEFERQYLTYLNILFELFEVPLHEFISDANDQELTTEELNVIIPPQLNSIVTFTRSFHLQLTEAMGSYECNPLILRSSCRLGELFLESQDFFINYYVPYIKIFDQAQNAIAEKLKKTPFYNFLLGRRSLIIGKGMDLISLLSLPLSRIPFYASQLQKILHATPSTTENYQKLVKASQAISDCLKLQQNEIHLINNKYKILEIEKTLKVRKPLLKPGRILLREGRLTLAPTKGVDSIRKEVSKYLTGKKGYGDAKKIQLNPYIDMFVRSISSTKKAGDVLNDIWNIRIAEFYVYVYLFNDLMVIKETSMIQKAFKGRAEQYDLTGAVILKHDQKRNSFGLRLRNEREFLFITENQISCSLWINDIRNVIDYMNESAKLRMIEEEEEHFENDFESFSDTDSEELDQEKTPTP